MPVLPPGRVLVDASFLLALAEQHAGASRLAAVLTRSIITSVNLGEVVYKLEQKAGMSAARTESLFVALGVVAVPVDVATARQFPELKRIDAASRSHQTSGLSKLTSLSLADMCCLGYARAYDLPVLTGDKHWLTLRPHGLTPQVFDFRDRTLTV